MSRAALSAYTETEFCGYASLRHRTLTFAVVVSLSIELLQYSGRGRIKTVLGISSKKNWGLSAFELILLVILPFTVILAL